MNSRSLRNHHELPKHLAAFEERLRLGDAFEGVGRVDDRLQLALGDQVKNSLELRPGAAVAANELELLGEEVPEVEPAVRAAGRAAGDQPAVPAERGDALLPGGGADVLDDDID